MIKAIETRYAGCLFRSRLEARWAVFFDTLGIRWEYEKEGYDLGEAGWYLPDFWLPESSTWVEVKSDIVPISIEPLKVFCAGKIGFHTHRADWRYGLLANGEDFFFATRREYTANPQGKLLDMVFGCKYTGPFSYDGLGGHGEGNARIIDNHGMEYPDLVVADCQKRICSSDVFFTWIDSEDCFGTLVELGYAAAFNKPIWIGCSESHAGDDLGTPPGNLWYAFASASRIKVASTPQAAFSAIYQESLSSEHRKCLALAIQSQKTVAVLHGSPWFNEHRVLAIGKYGTRSAGEFNPRIASAWKAKNTDVQSAFSAARSARFEHGESGAR